MRVWNLLAAAFLGTAAIGCSQSQAVAPALREPAQGAAPAERRAPAAITYRVLYAFRGLGSNDGAWPTSGLTERNGVLYGTTNSGGLPNKGNLGTVYSVTTAGSEKVVYTFGTTDGAKPFGGLTLLGDRFYGTTSAGGASGNGVIFEVNAADAVRVVHNFAGGAGGATPISTMLALDGALYGTTDAGGSGYGTIFKHNLSDGVQRVLYAFAGVPDGKQPRGALIDAGGSLYGTTLNGGDKKSAGTVYEVTSTEPPTERVLFRFTGLPGPINPQAGLVALDGAFYGTSQGGGETGYGSVYEVKKNSEVHTIYSFKGGDDGAVPISSLIVVNGLLYGTTSQGGPRNAGTVFELSKTGTERVLYAFLGTRDGQLPTGLLAKNNTLYGTTRYGGNVTACSLGCGTIYSITL
jgi:uncharacterized repeat protein (TIGR03803 family)